MTLRSTTAPPRSSRRGATRRPRSSRHLISGLVAIVLLLTVALSSPLPGTAASFTADARTSGNVVGTAALVEPRFTSIAQEENGIGLWWQPTFGLEAAITYTVERSVSGGAPTTIYTGLLPSFVDQGNFPMQARTITKVAAGENHVLGLDDAGDVWAWGSHSSGQLGNFTSDGATPQQVLFPGGAVITDIAAGKNHSLALDSNNNVWAWGANQLGQAGRDPRLAGGVIPLADKIRRDDGGPLRATAIAAGGDHSLAIDTDGRVRAWGDNEYGQVARGAGRWTSDATTVRLADGSPLLATAVAAGTGHSLAIDTDHEVVGWGMNRLGQLGDDTFTNRDVPVKAQLADASALPATSISAGGWASLAIAADDTVMAWGVGTTGQLGNGTRLNQISPEPVTFPDGRTFHASTVTAGTGHVLAIDGDKRVWAWGIPGYGALGNGASDGDVIDHPTETANGLLADSVAVGSGFSLAVGSGTVWAWGHNSSGQLGMGDTKQRSVPAVATTTEGLRACPSGSVPVDDGSACSLVSGTVYDYTVTTTLGPWTASSGVASIRAGTP
ncbi:RCC1 domain-containing protein [uncultured Microbacterium sp.]|uniref:RCC1 domain-containing protein n=1 Tax=uncultured Microbacterium sp. TaxID=191216 RepID=UPI0025D4889A|nr:RCC1 domain-containing protein [uncultured Microbacterium sp.]